MSRYRDDRRMTSGYARVSCFVEFLARVSSSDIYDFSFASCWSFFPFLFFVLFLRNKLQSRRSVLTYFHHESDNSRSLAQTTFQTFLPSPRERRGEKSIFLFFFFCQSNLDKRSRSNAENARKWQG